MFAVDLQWRGTLSEYVTALTWSSQGILAAGTAEGEVVLWQDGVLSSLLHPSSVGSIDCLAFSLDGRFLAAGGQDGQVRIWQQSPSSWDLINTLDNAPQWIDKLSWHPTKYNQLAFSLGRYVQIWDAEAQSVVTTLPFANSSVLDLAWRPNGKEMAIAGDGGVKVWQVDDWDEDPDVIDTASASLIIRWSTDSKYIASGNLDNTISVLEYGNPSPWVMRGFPGKISHLAWSQPLFKNTPLLASASMESIAVWKKDVEEGWSAHVLEMHDRKIQALAFHPHSLLLASGGDDGLIYLWIKAKQMGQILEGAPAGFSSLAWHLNGKQLAAGGQNGELIIWCESNRGKGFGVHNKR
ncbi:WD40 repeat domain-containing protein [Gloeocapsa sp. PCC 73106]|uniref:WD40 repeat domain-containing protein n=1 Tax=Gloeocapsa sp. PCC 73106 TaxID=102232 RepID=UPI0002ABA309|nr:hypothetical protein [Gloeocapsa sp. PCC 73106]ELR98283.1 WD40 repeat-containing protein [Gloeocapsa sp. PCC 73106]